jgi:hypothetical protein
LPPSDCSHEPCELVATGAETKYLRSLTPTGFSLAFAAAQTGQAAAPTQMALDLAG